MSAVSGLTVAVPEISNATVTGVTCAILVALFSVQSFGTGKVSAVFAPVVLLWLFSNAAIGLYNLAMQPGGWAIWGAVLNPASAIAVFQRRGFQAAWLLLNSVTLAVTGCEAMFADLGHFDSASIRVRVGFGGETVKL